LKLTKEINRKVRSTVRS